MGEEQYINLVNDILDNGKLIEGRNGKTLTVFGRSMRFNLNNSVIPR